MANIFKKFVDNRIEKILNDKNLNIDNGMSIMSDEKYYEEQNKVFYKADTPELLKFFKTRRPKTQYGSNNLFYRVVGGNAPVLHYPLANIITKTMVNLIFSNNPIFETSTGNKSKNKKYDELLYKIYEENDYEELFQKAAELESYSGAVAFKPILDPEYSEYPILMAYPKEEIEVIKKYDRVTEVIFKDYYENKLGKFMLLTICGKGYMDYALYKTNETGKRTRVELSTLEETKDLHKLYFYKRGGEQYDGLMCVYKENKAGAKSDYYNLTDDFAAIDEIYSNMMNFIRKSKIKTYRPENTLQYDTRSNKRIIPNDYDSDDIILYDSNPEGTSVKVERDMIDVNNSIMGYKEAFNNVLLNALSTGGLSPCSIGLDMAGANSSALALNIRERVSLRTRAEKIKRWKASLEELSKLLLSLVEVNANGENVYLNDYQYDVTVSFKEFETPTYSEQVAVLAEALNANLIDLESALKLLYPDKSDEEIELMLIQIDGQLPDGNKIEEKELEQEDDEEPLEEDQKDQKEEENKQ